MRDFDAPWFAEYRKSVERGFVQPDPNRKLTKSERRRIARHKIDYLLLRHLDRQAPAEVRERIVGPSAGGDDQVAGAVTVAAGFDVNLSTLGAQGRHRRPVVQRRAKTNGRAPKRVGRALGGDDPRIR